MGWTNEQLDAINARNTGIVVSAAAGSGKTSVLVERLIGVLSDTENQTPADRLIVVTFTNDAAAQMKQRLSDALSKKIAENPDNMWLCSQQSLLQTAKISTIHSFCFDLIRENIRSLDVSAGFRILDDAEEKLLRKKAVDNVFDYFYEKKPDAINTLAAFFSGHGRGDENFEEIVLDAYEFFMSIPYYDDWINERINFFKKPVDIATDPFAQQYISDLRETYVVILKKIEYLAKWYFNEFEIESECLKKEKEYVEKAINALGATNNSWDDRVCIKKIGRLSFTKPPASDKQKKTDDEIKEIMEEMQIFHKAYKAELNAIQDSFFTLKQIQEDYAVHAKIIDLMMTVITSFKDELAKIKAEKNALGFSDAEQLTIRLLTQKDSNGKICRTKLAEELSDYYSMIMIDEFQDANNNQDLIFKMLSKGGTPEKGGTNLFVVGDVKQSIYRFRLANPKLFIDVINKSEPYERDSYKGTNAAIYLNKNFRSSKPVVDFVNYVFSAIMSPKNGEVEYNENEKLVQGFIYPDGDRTTEVIIIPEGKDAVKGNDDTDGDKPSNENKTSDENKPSDENKTSDENKASDESKALKKDDATEASKKQDEKDDSEEISGITLDEPYVVAQKISSMLGNAKVYDKSAERPCEPKDFCILLRSKDAAKDYVKALAERGIKAHTEEPEGYLESREISVLVNLLAIIDNPMKNIPLASVLMSPMFMVTAEEMAELAILKDKEDKYFRIIKRVLEGETEIKKDAVLYVKLERFMQVFNKLRYCAASQRLERFIRTIYDSTDFLSAVQVYSDGRQKRANLHLLLDIAESYENNSGGGITGFVRYVEMNLKKGEMLHHASTVSASDNAVSIKTIHKSKGLEYPFIFLCGTLKKFNESDVKSNVIMNSDYGISFKVHDRGKLKRYDTFPHFSMQKIEKRNLVSEEMRLLYVALTRAREKLFITVPEKAGEKFERLKQNIMVFGGLTEEIVSKADSMMYWIYAMMLMHPKGDWFRAGAEVPLVDTAPAVRVVAAKADEQKAEEKKAEVVTADEKMVKKLKDAFSFSYEGNLTDKSAKFTVTEIAKGGDDDKLYLRRPEFVAEKDGLTAAERGTVTHAFMQYADFDAAEKDVISEAERLVEMGLLTEEECRSIILDEVSAFFNSDLYQRLKKSDNVRREQKFLIKKCDAALDDERLKGYNNNSMLQGIADCMFEEEDGFVLIDYKTDRVDSENVLVKRYDLQLKLYSAALGSIFDKPVKEAYIYSFALRKEIKVNIK